MDLSHVLWIGGPQGSGKSSIARALARRFDLQLYVVDWRTWVHEPRMPATEFGSLSLDERWLEATPERMLEWFVTTSRHRFRLVLEDLRELADSPLAVVEGPQLFPTFVASVLRDPRQALFLVPDEDQQRDRLLARPGILGTSDPVRSRANATARDLLILRTIDREARELRLARLPVDGPLAAMIERAVEHFEPLITGGPRRVELATLRRQENEVLATQVRLYRASLGGLAEDRPVAFACECGVPGRDDDVELSLPEYESLSAGGDRSPLRRPRP